MVLDIGYLEGLRKTIEGCLLASVEETVHQAWEAGVQANLVLGQPVGVQVVGVQCREHQVLVAKELACIPGVASVEYFVGLGV